MALKFKTLKHPAKENDVATYKNRNAWRYFTEIE